MRINLTSGRHKYTTFRSACERGPGSSQNILVTTWLFYATQRGIDQLSMFPTPTRTRPYSTVTAARTLSRPTSVTKPSGPARLGVRMSVLGPTIVSSLVCSAVELMRRSSSESIPPCIAAGAGGRSCIDVCRGLQRKLADQCLSSGSMYLEFRVERERSPGAGAIKSK